MPSGWHAGAHHVRNFSDGQGDIVLKCKCGWSSPARRDESEALAAEHMARFPSDDPSLVWKRAHATERAGIDRVPGAGRATNSEWV